ncbi:hypothetical protein C8A01DRAFT_49201 [Parachaetomium inaequale]|uniref:DUF676 domain-containing protein n=1 Tax=Parachaetomium inaequale TaxID=2588326 RepID=A0AAN6SP49_9PEZI|nr:hypothetical protein C8A01DRAFT_49201 [Parachaetomium inaequale]
MSLKHLLNLVHPGHEEFPSGIKGLHAPADAVVDVVFIHDLNGDREQSWTAQGASEPWPKTLLPAKLPTARVLTFGYDVMHPTKWRGVVSQNRIGDHAGNLLASLASLREADGTNERPILFVCHGLGGLVCEDALVMSKQKPEPYLRAIQQSTRGIAFLGTPHQGSNIADWYERWGRRLGHFRPTNLDIVSVLHRESEVLARIQNSFHTMLKARTVQALPPIEIACFYEELPLPGIGLAVSMQSAVCPGCGVPIGIHANHTDMTKFVGAHDPGFVALSRELGRWVREISRTAMQNAKPPSESFLKGGQGAARAWGPGGWQICHFSGVLLFGV